MSDPGGIAESGMDAVLGYALPRSVSAPHDEYEAVRRKAAWLPAPWERVLEVSGPDAASFLHNMLTQHIRGIDVGSFVPAALASRKGHLVADLTVHRAADHLFRLRVPEFASLEVAQVLERHQIMEDVTFRFPYDDPDGLLLVGPHSATVLEAVRPLLADSGVTVLPIRELTESDALLVFQRVSGDRVRELCTRAGALPVGWRSFDRRRIELGRAWFGIDADQERLVPEPGFDDRIHYQKGCYLGQEPLARLHFRGRPNWGLVRLTAPGTAAVESGADLVDGTSERVGWVTSVAPGADEPAMDGGEAEDEVLALGYLHRRFRESGAETVALREGSTLRWAPI